MKTTGIFFAARPFADQEGTDITLYDLGHYLISIFFFQNFPPTNIN